MNSESPSPVRRCRRHLRSGPGGRLPSVAIAVLVVGLLVTACGGSGSAEPSAMRQPDGLKTQLLRSDTGKRFTVRSSKGTVSVTAAPFDPSSGDDFRAGIRSGMIGEAFWPARQKERTDQQVCATLNPVISLTGRDRFDELQKQFYQGRLPGVLGVAFRIQPPQPDGHFTALTVSQKASWIGSWKLVVNAVTIRMDDGHRSARVRAVGVADMSASVGRMSSKNGLPDGKQWMKPGPWRLCAQAVGTKVTLKLWPTAEAEPSWRDRSRVRVVTLPAKFVYQGNAGGFASFLSRGATAKLSDLTVSAMY